MNWNFSLSYSALLLTSSLFSSSCFALETTDVITAIDGDTDDNFGWSVSLDGNTAIVGAYLHDNIDVDNNGSIDTHDGEPINNSGAAYIYINDGTGNWTQQAKLNAYSSLNDLDNTTNNRINVGPDNLPQRDAWFGYSVGISGDIAVVGSPYFDLAAETATLQVDSDSDGVIDSEDAFPEDPSEFLDSDNDGIGNFADTDDDNNNIADVDTDSDGIIDPFDIFPLNPGEYIDTDNDGVGNNTDNDDDGDGVLDINDAFPLDKTKDTNVGDTQDILDAGMIYIFERNGTSWNLVYRFTIEKSRVANGDLYGSSVAIHNNTIVIGALSQGRSGDVFIVYKDTTED